MKLYGGGGMGVYLHSLLIEVICQLHNTADLFPGKLPPVQNGLEAGWCSQTSSGLFGEEKSLLMSRGTE